MEVNEQGKIKLEIRSKIIIENENREEKSFVVDVDGNKDMFFPGFQALKSGLLVSDDEGSIGGSSGGEREEEERERDAVEKSVRHGRDATRCGGGKQLGQQEATVEDEQNIKGGVEMKENQQLHKDNYADLRALQELARGELARIQHHLQEDPMNSMTIQAEEEARSRYINILSSSMTLMKQQCKMEWISYGDDNSRTFFARAKQRKLASYIYQIKDTKGDLVEGFDMVGQTMMTYYKALLGEQYITRQKFDMDVMNQGPTLTKEQQVHMCQDFTDLDIREAIFSIPNNKSRGPYGFNSGFFKHTWVIQITRCPRDMNGNGKLKGKYPRQANLGKAKYTKECFHLTEEEDEYHLFYSYNYAKTKRKELRQWWRHTPNVQNSSQLLRGLKQTTFYDIWSARNHRIFKKQQITAYQTAYLIKDQVRSRILLLNTCSKKFSAYNDSLLN
ncbi:LOW QUALITY PROTEIN: hypothetical protein Cgig2_011558 [Carnegiea gigantea]|uniref:Uncharacterized protein n=1 Tax=Carnegiea gigantea TaxID=171969 RepID=A0A9Q1JL56_9CARY|nr:LOW QUALITY PROTEIN: hypothetical protein Cgig2_011558 [Carnegiea gigantea]